jgi:2-polyprenyl-3-methyl-5-hydroxy-6-metoxy-1,4-benzoquinol methylase
MQKHPSDEEMRAYYAERAPYYDSVYEKPARAQDIAFLKSYLPSVFVSKRVLEVACGTGFWTQHIAGAAKQLVATDATAEPLSFARSRPQCASVSFSQEDAYALSESLGMFDAGFAGLWFSHVPIEARQHFFASLHARLLPGATVVFIDNNHTQLNDFPIVETDALGNSYQLRPLKNGAVHRVLKNFPTDDELTKLVSQFSKSYSIRQLENFWMLEYSLTEH